MSCFLRKATVDELPSLAALCLRSKAVWGYDNRFIESCREELTIKPDELQSSSIAVAEKHGKIVGVVQVKAVGTEAELLKLFVEPSMLRVGVGMQLFIWATDQAISRGAVSLIIEADPCAVPFYKQMGAVDCGLALSRSISGRMLPVLVKKLQFPAT